MFSTGSELFCFSRCCFQLIEAQYTAYFPYVLQNGFSYAVKYHLDNSTEVSDEVLKLTKYIFIFNSCKALGESYYSNITSNECYFLLGPMNFFLYDLSG